MDYDWPGNVRELENVIERGVVLTTDAAHRPRAHPRPRAHGAQLPRPPHDGAARGHQPADVIASFERRLIESTLESTGGVQKEAARLLGLKPTTLNEMIKRHNILLPRERERERRAAKEVEAAARQAGRPARP